jgi:hypothetical protein
MPAWFLGGGDWEKGGGDWNSGGKRRKRFLVCRRRMTTVSRMTSGRHRSLGTRGLRRHHAQLERINSGQPWGKAEEANSKPPDVKTERPSAVFSNNARLRKLV